MWGALAAAAAADGLMARLMAARRSAGYSRRRQVTTPADSSGCTADRRYGSNVTAGNQGMLVVSAAATRTTFWQVEVWEQTGAATSCALMVA